MLYWIRVDSNLMTGCLYNKREIWTQRGNLVTDAM